MIENELMRNLRIQFHKYLMCEKHTGAQKWKFTLSTLMSLFMIIVMLNRVYSNMMLICYQFSALLFYQSYQF